MSEPIKIVVTAQTAEAAANLKAFCGQSANDLKVLAGAATAPDSSLRDLRETTLGLREGFHALEAGVYLLGGQRFPQLAEAVMGVRSAMLLTRTGALLTGASLAAVSSVLIAAAVSTLPAAVAAWEAYKAKQEETTAAALEFAQTQELITRNQNAVEEAFARQLISPEQAALIQDYLNLGTNDSLRKAQGLMAQAGISETQIEHYDKLKKLEQEMHEATLDHFDQESAKASETYQKRLDEIQKLAFANGITNAERNTAEQGAMAEFNAAGVRIDTEKQKQAAQDAIALHKDTQTSIISVAEAGKEKREGFTEEEFGNEIAFLYDLKKQYPLADDEITKANLAATEQRVIGIRAEAAEQKKLNDEKKQASQLQAEIARAQVAAQLKSIEGDPLLTKQGKDQKSLPLYKTEMSDNEGLMNDQLAIENSPASSDLQKAEAKKEYNKLLGDQAELENKIKAIEGENSFAYNWLADITALQSKLPTLAQSMASVFVSPFDGIQSGFNSAIIKMMEHGGSFKSFMITIGQSIEKSFIQSVAGMASSFITSSALMLVKHIAMEMGMTAATTAGGVARNAIRMFETTFHGIMVAMRTAAHLAGELLCTAATTAGAIIRAGKYLITAAIAAMSAEAGIPVVGPIIAVAAAAGIIGAGMGLMHGFSEGGYTGDGPRNQIAGVVHGGEFVLPADFVARHGLGKVEAMMRGGSGGGSAPDSSGSNVNLHFHDKRPHPKDFLASPEGQNMIVDISRKNRMKIGIPT